MYINKPSTRYKWCKSCRENCFKIEINWTSEKDNEKVDKFIHKMQLNIDHPTDTIFEWIPYKQFNDIEEIRKGNLATAIWKDGPLYWDIEDKEYIRSSDEIVVLKYLDSEEFDSEEFLNKSLKEYSLKEYGIKMIYGISQDLITRNYLLVLNNYLEEFCAKCGEQYTYVDMKWCKPCQINYLNNHINLICKDEKTDNLIYEMQLKIDHPTDTIFEWIPYNQFNDIKEIRKGTLATSIWKDGPLYWNIKNKEYERYSDEVIVLKYFNTKEFDSERLLLDKIFGVSQDPITKDYLLILDNNYLENFCVKCDKQYTDVYEKWCKSCQINYLNNHINLICKDEKIDSFIYEIQLKIDHPTDIIFEWIPYNQFNDIKKIRKCNFVTAIWKDGPLYWNNKNKEYTRYSEQMVVLEYLDSEEFVSEILLNKILKEYSIKSHGTRKLYGISQDPVTEDYLLILNNYLDKYCVKCDEQYTYVYKKWCLPCQINYLNIHINSTSKEERIDKLIRRMQLNIGHPTDIIFEWIPYNQFNDTKEISKGTLATSIWKDGPLYWNSVYKEYIGNSDEIVALEYFDAEEFDNEGSFLNMVLKDYSIEKYGIKKILYGISQDPVTGSYLFILNDNYLKNICTKCGKQYYANTHAYRTWCRPCQINYARISRFIQGMQLKVDVCKDITFEWIPYNQFSDVKRIGKGGFSTVYSAIWKNGGPLRYYKDKNEWIRDPNKKVALKCLNNSQNITIEFLNEVKAYLIYNFDKILKSLWNISRSGYKILHYGSSICGSNIINGLKAVHQKQMVHRDFHIGNILFEKIHLFTSNYISDMGLCGEIGNIDETNIYGVMPYVAPEVLRGKPYTQKADVYSFSMIMYFVATGKQPFSNCAHDHLLVYDICKGTRPEINEPEAPKCYIDLMKKCWDSNPTNRPNATKIENFIISFYNSYCSEIIQDDNEIKKQFQEAEKYRSTNRNIKSTFHPQAIYTSRLLNFFTKDLPEIHIEDYTQCINNRTECLDCAI
ncbi:unnamed protein product [Rhizophagus irregularis]|nr:unnamed protein product [Rhizophagus irregularis]